MRLLQWLLAFSLLLVGVRYSWATLLLLRGAGWIAGRLLHLCVLLVGSGSFWWVLRSYQLQKEQELLDHALLKFKYYSRYRTRTGSNSMEVSNGPRSSSNEDFPKAASVSSNVSMMDAGFHLRVLKRLPVVAYLRTSWSLPPEICEEIAALAQLIVQDYVSYWFQSISPNEGFPNDVRFLLADLLGAVASRVLEIDSSQALTMVSKSLELLRLHLGWFREAYAQLADEYPSVFEGDEHDSNLLKRQEYIKAFAHRSQFLHPGVVSGLSCSSHTTIASPIPAGSSSGKKNASENAEASYLRHVATQLLTQLKPQFGQQCDTNVFVSVAMNLLREITAFKILKPLTEYSQPRYANEVVLSCLQAFADEKDPQSSPISLGSNGMMPTLTLNKLRTTSSFLYKASKRSGVQAEAAFQAMVDAVASAASSAAVGAAELVMEGDEWVDSGSNPFAFGSAVFTANSGGEKKAIPSLFATDDRISVTKAAKMMNPRGFIPGSLLSHKMTGENSRISTHMDDLKNAKANIGSSLNSSIGKVKNRLRTLGSHQMDPLSTPPLSTGAAARMIRKPGQLLQKAWKRGESGVSSPTSSFDDGAATPNSARSRGHSDANSISSLNPLLSPLGDDQEGSTPRTASRAAKMVAVRDRVVQHLEKAVASYTKMYDECSEMHNSARSRELYELLLAIEDTVMLGFRNQDSTTLSSEESEDKDNEEPRTPPLSPNVRRRSSLPLTRIEVMSPRRDSTGTERGSESDWEVNDNQYYWEYLARDRPGAASLNVHWRFVASQCPDCSPSESFVSTRGVQWILIALENGMVGTFFTELYVHHDVTEAFYESYSVLRDCPLMEFVIKCLSQLDKLKICLDMPIPLGRQQDMDQELSDLPFAQRQSPVLASPSTPVRVIERVWETERYVPMNGWVKTNGKRWKELPSSEWIWEDDWTLENTENDAGDSSDSDAQKSAWEYAKTFEDNFHDKEKKFDSVRRRRWIRRRRQLPPVLALAPSLISPSGVNAVSRLTSGTASNGLGKAQKLKQRFNALKRGKKDTMEATKMTLLKRRSQSFDKDFPGSPGTNSSLAVFEADDTPATSTKTSAFTKARASIPSLRRGTSNKSMKSTVDAQELTAAPSMDDDDVVYFNGDDDDDNLCFRCLKALPASKSGVGSCQSCHQRVCISCLNFFAFMVYPPPLETSKKTRVCGNCYDRLVSKYKLRIEAHVGKYLIKDRERELSDLYNSATSSSTTTISSTYGSPQNGVSLTRDDTPENTDGSASIGQPVNMSSLTVGRATGSTKFEITVKVKDGCAYAWSVIKTFHDFEVLEKHLAEKMKQQEKKFGVGCQSCHWRGVDYMEMVSVKPSLKTVAATTLSYEKRLQVLEHFLQQLLACDTLCQSSIVQKFLLLANAYGTSVTADSSRWETGEYATSLSVASSMGAGAISSAGGISGTNGVLVENGKWRKGRWIAPDANSKETKMRVLQSIEVSLFSVLGELFEFDGIGLVRRQIFSMTRSFIKAFLGASHFRMLERQFLSFTDPKNLSGWIGDLRAYIFPDPSVADAVAASPPAPDMQELRKDCLEAILASFPSKALSLFGDTPCQNAALKLHEFLQHEVFVKNLLFSITDELLLHLFPDSTTFKGKKGSATTPAAPAAATKGVDETSAEVPASATP